MRAFKGQAKLSLRPDMLWCAPQIRAKGYIAFLLSLPLFTPCLKGVGGEERKKTEEKRDREREGVMNRLPAFSF